MWCILQWLWLTRALYRVHNSDETSRQRWKQEYQASVQEFLNITTIVLEKYAIKYTIKVLAWSFFFLFFLCWKYSYRYTFINSQWIPKTPGSKNLVNVSSNLRICVHTLPKAIHVVFFMIFCGLNGTCCFSRNKKDLKWWHILNSL